MNVGDHIWLYLNLDEIHDLVENIISTDIGIVVESDLNYGFVIDGNIEIATFSSSVNSLLSESLGIDFELEDDSVIFFLFFCAFKLHQVWGTSNAIAHIH